MGSFGPKFFISVRMNSTIFGVKEQNKNKLEFLLKSLTRLNNQTHSTNRILPTIFVISQERDEPLMGIKENIRMLSTKPFKMAQLADSVTGLLRLNEEGSSKFLQMNHSIFFIRNMAQEFLKQFQ
ncbi:hypothetical protein RhiirA4_538675 [Rhizophagus irregularis]|uniref:Uncharacterized protein n=1 Tax=Rhizophagus irregularis TaxID=588596 RepID=A0A2I1G0R8_9GLOM|nr:hypothetical protein RhiirA4_538675 [Rhizophagus irregularis]